MANYDAAIRINTNINLDKMDKYKINTESLERVRKNIEKIQQVLTDSFNIQTSKQSFEMFNMIVEDSLKKITSVFKQHDYENILKEICLSIAEMSEKIDIKQLETLQNIDFGKLVKDSFYQIRYDEASNMAFEYVEEEVKSEENITQEELLEIFNEQIEGKDGWQEKLRGKSEEFKEKYAIFYKFITWFLNILVTAAVTYFLNLGIACLHGKIVSEPKENSPVIYYFDPRTEVNIIGETDNYYFIIYTDDDGNAVTGYSRKEDIEIVPEDDIRTTEEAK